MKETESKSKFGKAIYLREFSNLDDFHNYINNTPLNEVFRWRKLSSSKSGYGFTKTHTFEEADQLFKNGWESMAKKLTAKLKVKQDQTMSSTMKKTFYDIVGFQASVPRYLQGIPTNMVNTKLVPTKQKVITLNKDISYNCSITTEQIIEASTQTLKLIKLIEARNIRVNLNLIWGLKDGGTQEVLKIRLKSAGERLNLSKLAFPLVHPSMLRRLCFRYVEVAPTITAGYAFGYGSPLDGKELKAFCEGEYLLPRLFDGDLATIGDLGHICNLTEQIVNGKKDIAKI